MLKSRIIKFRFTGGGSITDNEESDILRSLLGVVGLSGDEILDKLDGDRYDKDGDRIKIKYIAEQFTNKIISVEPIRINNGSLFLTDEFSTHHYGIVYDNEIEATFEKNLEIVRNEFIMNGF